MRERRDGVLAQIREASCGCVCAAREVKVEIEVVNADAPAASSAPIIDTIVAVSE